MTSEKAIEIKTFVTTWISKVVGKKKDYKERLLKVINDLFPDDISEYDPWGILDIDNWDRGKYSGMGDRLRELLECDNVFSLSTRAVSDISCAIRIGIDLYIKQSGGVVGYTVGDLRKVFDGNIPVEIASSFEGDISAAKDCEGIWL